MVDELSSRGKSALPEIQRARSNLKAAANQEFVPELEWAEDSIERNWEAQMVMFWADPYLREAEERISRR